MQCFSSTDVWMEMLDNQNLLETQYDLLAGNWPKAYNEVALIIGENQGIALTLLDYYFAPLLILYSSYLSLYF